MSSAISVYHGQFGRAALYHLDRALTMHAHREGHLVFHVSAASGVLTVNNSKQRCDQSCAVAVNPWEAHNFLPACERSGTICLVLYINPNWFNDRLVHGSKRQLRFGQSEILIDAQIRKLVDLVSHRLKHAAEDAEFDECLFALTDACYHASLTPRAGLASPSNEVRLFNDFRIRKSIRIMQDQIGFNLDMDEIARESGLS